MAQVIRQIAGVVLGLCAWTLTEYLVHRWPLHRWALRRNQPVTRVDMSRAHTLHHHDPAATRPAHRAAAMTAIAAASAAIAPLVTPPVAAGWCAGYAVYDVQHWALHHRPARTAIGRELRIRHLRHHFGSVDSNLGVTTGFWDRAFGTEASDGPTRVPRRNSPDWLLETDDERTLAELVVR